MIWTSRDGLTWQRMTAAQLGLAGPGETVLNISYATWRGNATVISGAVSSGQGPYDAAWLSTNGGTAWTRLTIPADHGAGTAISGLGFDGSGLIAVRPGRTASGAAGRHRLLLAERADVAVRGHDRPGPKTAGGRPAW